MLPHPVTNRTLSVLGAQQEISHAAVTAREHPKILVYTVYVYVRTYAAYMERPEDSHKNTKYLEEVPIPQQHLVGGLSCCCKLN